MDIVSINCLSGTASLSVTVDELAFIANSISESLMAVEDRDFQTLLGLTPAEAASFRDKVSEVIRAAPPQTYRSTRTQRGYERAVERSVA